MSLNHVILAMLQFGPQTGYDLDKQIKDYVHFSWTTNQSQVYRTLYKLRDKGWVDIKTIIQEDSPNKKEYSLTESGLNELKNWLATPGLEGVERDPFMAQLLWGGLISPTEQLEVIKAKMQESKEYLDQLEATAEQVGLPVPMPKDAFTGKYHRNQIGLEYGIIFYRWRIGWFEHIIELLEVAEEAEKE